MSFFWAQLKIWNFFIVRDPVYGQSLIKYFFVDDIHTDKNITVSENGTEWETTTEDNQEGSEITEEGNT
jgi:hypothetical protein